LFVASRLITCLLDAAYKRLALARFNDPTFFFLSLLWQQNKNKCYWHRLCEANRQAQNPGRLLPLVVCYTTIKTIYRPPVSSTIPAHLINSRCLPCSVSAHILLTRRQFTRDQWKLAGESEPRMQSEVCQSVTPLHPFRALLKSSSQVVPSASNKPGNFAQQAAVGLRLQLPGTPGPEAITTEKLYIYSYAKIQPVTTPSLEKKDNKRRHQK
jgi:hypothetical protein